MDMGLTFSCHSIPAPLWQDSPIWQYPAGKVFELFLLLKCSLLVWLCCKTIQYKVSSIFTIWKGPWRPGMYTWRIQMIKIFPFDTQQGSNGFQFHTVSNRAREKERKDDPSWHQLVFTFFYVRQGYWLHSKSLVEDMDERKDSYRHICGTVS